MTPLSSEFDKFVKKVTKFMEQIEQNQEFLKQQLIYTQIELYALKKELKEKGIIDDTATN